MIPLRDNTPSSRAPAVNYAIIIINVMIFFYEASLDRHHLEVLIMSLGFIPERFLSQFGEADLVGSSLPIFTSMFLHGGWLHLIGNMWTLYIFGDNVEDTFGHGSFLAFYLICGVTACLAQLALAPHSSIPMVGASGAIAGVMGAYFFLFPHARILTLVPVVFFVIIEVPAYVFLGIWFLVQFLFSTVSAGGAEVKGGVAFWAHIGGFATGYVLVRLFAYGKIQAARPPAGPPGKR
jgi:membrane associated rhomboid family serine protease